MSCLITMSQKELHRLELIQRIRGRSLTVVEAAALLRLSRSQVHRLLQAYDKAGADGLVSKKRGRPSTRLSSGTLMALSTAISMLLTNCWLQQKIRKFLLSSLLYRFLRRLSWLIFEQGQHLEKLDRRLLEASADLGAKPVSSFFGVTLPLSLPGVMTGVALVTILLLGEYLIPQLLGGGKVFFIGNALVDLFLQSRNWPFGSAIAVTLVAVVVIVLMVAMRIAWKVAGTRQVDLV